MVVHGLNSPDSANSLNRLRESTTGGIGRLDYLRRRPMLLNQSKPGSQPTLQRNRTVSYNRYTSSRCQPRHGANRGPTAGVQHHVWRHESSGKLWQANDGRFVGTFPPASVDERRWVATM
jgi:hypothetical protein